MKDTTDEFFRQWVTVRNAHVDYAQALFRTANLLRGFSLALDLRAVDDLDARVHVGTALAVVEHLHTLAVPTVDAPPGPPSTGAAEEGS